MRLYEVGKRRAAVSDENLAKVLKDAQHNFRKQLMELLSQDLAPGPFKTIPPREGTSKKFWDPADLPNVRSQNDSSEWPENMDAWISEGQGNLMMNISYTARDGMPGLGEKIEKLRELAKKHVVQPRIDRTKHPNMTASVTFFLAGI